MMQISGDAVLTLVCSGVGSWIAMAMRMRLIEWRLKRIERHVGLEVAHEH
jgi:hypothetical protein